MDQALPGQANLYVWVTVLVVVAAVFTIIGGLTAVLWTDTLQTVIMLIGAFVLTVISFREVTRSVHCCHLTPHIFEKLILFECIYKVSVLLAWHVKYAVPHHTTGD